jgi:hypothetical protein
MSKDPPFAPQRVTPIRAEPDGLIALSKVRFTDAGTDTGTHVASKTLKLWYDLASRRYVIQRLVEDKTVSVRRFPEHNVNFEELADEPLMRKS